MAERKCPSSRGRLAGGALEVQRDRADERVVDEHQRTVSFGEFRDLAERAAAGLCAHGVREHTRVMWMLPTWIESLVLSAALARLGAVQVPLIPVYREREIGFIARQCAAPLLLIPPLSAMSLM